MANDEKFSLEDAYKNLDRVNYWLGNGDVKISFALAFIGAIMAFVFSSDKTAEAITKYFTNAIHFDLHTKKCYCAVAMSILFLLFAVYIITSIRFLLKGLRAKIDPKEFLQADLVTDSKIFWVTISGKPFREYKNSLVGYTRKELLKDVNSQVYINSKICTLKFQNFNKGMESLIIAFVILVIFKLLSFVVLQ